MKKRKIPLTTGGKLKCQAEDIIRKVEETLVRSGLKRDRFILYVSANVVRNWCDITVASVDSPMYESVTMELYFIDPFDNDKQFAQIKVAIIQHFRFATCEKITNQRQYIFRK